MLIELREWLIRVVRVCLIVESPGSIVQLEVLKEWHSWERMLDNLLSVHPSVELFTSEVLEELHAWEWVLDDLLGVHPSIKLFSI